jgi:hypothetical protein
MGYEIKPDPKNYLTKRCPINPNPHGWRKFSCISRDGGRGQQV